MTHALRGFVLALGRLNLWIAALLLAGLLQHQQGALQASLAQQISAQPVGVLATAPKFALAKPAATEARARLIPLLDTVQSAVPAQVSGFHLLRRAEPLSVPRPSPNHGWQARAPPSLPATALL